MIDLVVKVVNEVDRAMDAVRRGTVRALRKAAYAVFRSAQQSIESLPGPSAAGQPPHTHRGRYLARAIRYDVDEANLVGVVGPRESVVGTSAEAHEFGGEYKDAYFEPRPFMGPALERNRAMLPSAWSGELHEGAA